jgi:TolA-binding protein
MGPEEQTVEVSRPSSSLERDLAAYRVAHRLHFGGAAPERALSAWRAYLEAFPQGVLAVEAHYNLALCLLKAGHSGEAERQLEAIARGRHGSYRSAEARGLLAALRARRQNAHGGTPE